MFCNVNASRISFLVTVGVSVLILATLSSGCPDGYMELMAMEKGDGSGGGQDVIMSAMPFASGYQSRCVQGTGSSYSHMYDSTYFDVDFDTPNGENDPVFAPMGGTAYVHDANRTDGFGVHINIDQGDGTYLILGHLDDTFVGDGEEVAAGQMIGLEGTTGYSTGDHVHFGRHDGDAEEDGTDGESIEGLSINAVDLSGDGSGDYLTSEMDCDLSTGHIFESTMPTPKWHPDGTLVMTPGESTVYLLSDGLASPFLSEDSFWSRGYSFEDVSLVSNTELDCFGSGSEIDGTANIMAVYEDGLVWLLLDSVESAGKTRFLVRSTGWQAVLKSYGIIASTYDDLLTPSSASVDLDDYPIEMGYALFRDGSLLKESTKSTVYVVSDATAMPIDGWDTYLLMDFYTRSIIEVDAGVVAGVQGQVGDCSADAYCVTSENLFTCGGSADAYSSTGTRDDEVDEPADTGTGHDTVDETPEQSVDTQASSSGTGLSINWQSPSSRDYSRITMSGEYTQSSGYSHGWQDLAEVSNDHAVQYDVGDARSGDSLRFSVEFEDSSGNRSWSCLAPYPSGTVQGTASADFDGSEISVTTADDPSSNGCGLLVEVP